MKRVSERSGEGGEDLLNEESKSEEWGGGRGSVE